MSDPARWVMGALVRSGAALMAFGNRRPDSLTCLRQGKEAPSTITWGRFNRHALVRLPIQATTADGTVVTPPTIEFRLPDGSVHPHLLLAAVALAMIDARSSSDLEAVLSGSQAGDGTGAGTGAVSVPLNFDEVAAALEAQRPAFEHGDVFTPRMLDATVAGLRATPSPSGV